MQDSGCRFLYPPKYLTLLVTPYSALVLAGNLHLLKFGEGRFENKCLNRVVSCADRSYSILVE